jgi:hypothetical protein
MARQKQWYSIYLNGKQITRVKSKGLAYIVYNRLKEIYKDKGVLTMK